MLKSFEALKAMVSVETPALRKSFSAKLPHGGVTELIYIAAQVENRPHDPIRVLAQCSSPWLFLDCYDSFAVLEPLYLS